MLTGICSRPKGVNALKRAYCISANWWILWSLFFKLSVNALKRAYCISTIPDFPLNPTKEYCVNALKRAYCISTFCNAVGHAFTCMCQCPKTGLLHFYEIVLCEADEYIDGVNALKRAYCISTVRSEKLFLRVIHRIFWKLIFFDLKMGCSHFVHIFMFHYILFPDFFQCFFQSSLKIFWTIFWTFWYPTNVLLSLLSARR